MTLKQGGLCWGKQRLLGRVEGTVWMNVIKVNETLELKTSVVMKPITTYNECTPMKYCNLKFKSVLPI